jgi:hypothetical protein
MMVRALLIVLALSVVTGCGTASAPSPPAGVDELVIPTPSPDPDDFVARVDNRWFPLTPGTTWTYAVLDASGNHRLRVRVADRAREIAGVATTAVVSVERRRRTVDYYAQDRAGNVWWFGHIGPDAGTAVEPWLAGRDGAEAGVAMLATPRVGDGYRRAYLPGAVDQVAQIDSVTETAQTPSGAYDDVVLTTDTSPLDPGTTVHRSYAPGVGLVAERVVSGRYRTVELVSVG